MEIDKDFDKDRENSQYLQNVPSWEKKIIDHWTVEFCASRNYTCRWFKVDFVRYYSIGACAYKLLVIYSYLYLCFKEASHVLFLNNQSFQIWFLKDGFLKDLNRTLEEIIYAYITRHIKYSKINLAMWGMNIIFIITINQRKYLNMSSF